MTIGTEPESEAPRGASAAPVIDMSLLGRALLRALLPAVLIGVLAGVIVGVVVAQRAPVYESTTQLVVSSTARGGQDATQLEASASTYAAALEDDDLVRAIEKRTGRDITTSGSSATVSAATSEVPGVVTLVAHGSSPEEAADTATIAGEELASASTRLSAASLAPYEKATDELTAALRAQIARQGSAGSGSSPSADDLREQSAEVNQQLDDLRRSSTGLTPLSRSTSESRTSPRPVLQGAVAGLVVAVIALVVLAAYLARRRRQADALWSRRTANSAGAVRDSAPPATPTGLPPMSEAAAVAALDRGEDVVVLAAEDGTEVDIETDDEHLHRAAWTSPWWREVAPDHVGLGIVVVDAGHRGRLDEAERALAHLAASGVRTRLAVRES